MPRSIMLCVAMLSASAAMAGELPKEGKFSGTYHSSGTLKIASMGKDTISGWDETGYWLVTDGPRAFDHVTWRCMGGGHVLSGIFGYRGHCIGTDTSGDQMVIEVMSANASTPADAKSVPGKTTFVSGTGKFAGITGGTTDELFHPQFKVSADNTYVQLVKFEGTYRLP